MDNYSPPKKMKLVGDLFEKYKIKIKAPQKSVEKECVKIISEVSPFTILETQVTYTVSTRTLYIKVPSVLKSELKFYYSKILNEFTIKLGEESSPKTII